MIRPDLFFENKTFERVLVESASGEGLSDSVESLDQSVDLIFSIVEGQ